MVFHGDCINVTSRTSVLVVKGGLKRNGAKSAGDFTPQKTGDNMNPVPSPLYLLSDPARPARYFFEYIPAMKSTISGTMLLPQPVALAMLSAFLVAGEIKLGTLKSSAMLA